LNIKLQALKALVSKLPDHYKLFSLSSNGDIIACTITVVTGKDVLYYFLPAHNPKYDTYSPMVYLLKKIYEYARKHQFKYLDLGISSIENKPQPDLIKFKERMGGITTSKLLFSRNL
jgi:CelD/BcsL family acetyltransferase involved in cellulose biosynthesis